MLTIENIEVTYHHTVQALRGLSLEVPDGKIVTLLGTNGAGKTTTLRSIMGLWKPSPGSVQFRGEDITALHTADIARKGIDYVPENTGIFMPLLHI